MKVSEIRDKFRDVALNLSTIKTFTFDDLDQIATDQNLDYRLLHLTVPTETIINDINKPYETWPIEFFIFDLDKDFNSDERVTAWEEIEEKGIEFIKALLVTPSEARLNPKSIAKTRGHLQFVDKLVGVKFVITIEFFSNSHCT